MTALRREAERLQVVTNGAGAMRDAEVPTIILFHIRKLTHGLSL